MTSELPTGSLALRWLVTERSTLELSLDEVSVPAPTSGQVRLP